MSEILSREEFEKLKVQESCDTAVAVSDFQGRAREMIPTIEVLAGALKGEVIGPGKILQGWSRESCPLLTELLEKGWL